MKNLSLLLVTLFSVNLFAGDIWSLSCMAQDTFGVNSSWVNSSNVTILSLDINISLNLSTNSTTRGNDVSIYGRLNDSEGNGIANNEIKIYFNETEYYEPKKTWIYEKIS